MINLIIYCDGMDGSKRESRISLQFEINQFCYDSVNIRKSETI